MFGLREGDGIKCWKGWNEHGRGLKGWVVQVAKLPGLKGLV